MPKFGKTRNPNQSLKLIYRMIKQTNLDAKQKILMESSPIQRRTETEMDSKTGGENHDGETI